MNVTAHVIWGIGRSSRRSRQLKRLREAARCVLSIRYVFGILPAPSRAFRAEPRRSELQQLPLAELVDRCRAETEKFLRREPHRDDYCLELFRRAIGESDQAAWAAVVGQYRGMVLSWVRRHPAWSTAREDEDYWVNRTFERFWTAIGPDRLAAFPGLAALLRYLKMCAHSVLLDEVRSQAPVALETSADPPAEADPAQDVEGLVTGRVAAGELWAAVRAETQDEAERIVAYLCLAHGLKPREIVERHPDRFAGVADVYRAKRNLLDRLRRSPDIQKFLD